jgi:hypothetical protein
MEPSETPSRIKLIGLSSLLLGCWLLSAALEPLPEISPAPSLKPPQTAALSVYTSDMTKLTDYLFDGYQGKKRWA